jgi:hypothetical protein
MSEYIPFVTGEDTRKLVQRLYPDSEIIRVPLGGENPLRLLNA